jgi:DNA-binding beta-propeller fold protein YncE
MYNRGAGQDRAIAWVLGMVAGVGILAGPSAALAAPPAFTPVGTTSTGTGSKPRSVAFSPDGGLLATVSNGPSTVSTYSVSAGGALTAGGTPAPTGTNPWSVAFRPDGRLLATANIGDDNVSVFSVSAGGALTSVGPPTSPGFDSGPISLAFNPDGRLLATANFGDSTVSVFSVSAGGALTEVARATTGTGCFPQWVAFSPVV